MRLRSSNHPYLRGINAPAIESGCKGKERNHQDQRKGDLENSHLRMPIPVKNEENHLVIWTLYGAKEQRSKRDRKNQPYMLTCFLFFKSVCCRMGWDWKLRVLLRLDECGHCLLFISEEDREQCLIEDSESRDGPKQHGTCHQNFIFQGSRLGKFDRSLAQDGSAIQSAQL